MTKLKMKINDTKESLKSKIPSMPKRPTIPSLAEVKLSVKAKLPAIPQLPQIPSVREYLPDLPTIPEVPLPEPV